MPSLFQFTDEETEAFSGEGACPASLNSRVNNETPRSPQYPLPPCMCPQSGFSVPNPCPHGKVMRRVGTTRGHFLQASQQHPKMCPHCTDREGKGVQTTAQGSGWLTQDHTATQDWGPAASLHTLSPALPHPTL